MEEQKAKSIKLYNVELLEKAIEVAIAKNILSKKNYSQLFEILLNDFINNQALSDMNRINMISSITDVITNELLLFEERLGNRSLKSISELAIQLSVTNQMIYEFITKYDNKTDAEEKYQKFRKRAIEQLRENKLVLKSTDFYEKNNN